MLGIQHPDYPCMQRTATSSLPRAHLTAYRSRTCICCYLHRSVRCSISSLPEFHPRARGVSGSAPAPRGDSAGRAPSRRRCSAPRPTPGLLTWPLPRSGWKVAPPQRRAGQQQPGPSPGFSTRAVKVLPTPNKSFQREGSQAMKDAKSISKLGEKKRCT